VQVFKGGCSTMIVTLEHFCKNGLGHLQIVNTSVCKMLGVRQRKGMSQKIPSEACYLNFVSQISSPFALGEWLWLRNPLPLPCLLLYKMWVYLGCQTDLISK
jgi:hypothetical protein